MRLDDGEYVFLDARRHGIVLARPLLRALVLGVLGGLALLGGWPVSILGVAVLMVAAGVALGAVVRWDRTRLVLTNEKLFLVRGVLRRHASAVHLARLRTVEIDRSLRGRLLGYGTIVAGDLELEFVARPGEVYRLVERALDLRDGVDEHTFARYTGRSWQPTNSSSTAPASTT